jgi:hypothetical protein
MHTDTISQASELAGAAHDPAEAAEVRSREPEAGIAAPGLASSAKRLPIRESQTLAPADVFGDARKLLQAELCPQRLRASQPRAPQELGLQVEWRPSYTAAEQMYYQLRENGYHAEVIPTEEMMRYLVHLAHATAGLRPAQRRLEHRHAQKKSERRLRRLFGSDLAQSLAADTSLDR